MVISVGGIMLTQFQPQTYEHITVTGETEASTGTIPETITADNVGQGLETNTETITFYDNDTATNYTLEKDTDYEVISYDSGEFNITNADPDGDSTDEIDSVNDTYYLDYTYNQEGSATTVVSKGLNALETFGSFFTVIVVVGIGAVLLLLLKVFRSAGRGTTQAMA